jgi:imidazolonepropionase
MNADLLIIHASQLLTIATFNGEPQRGRALGDLGLIEDGALAIHGESIIDAGSSSDLLTRCSATHTIDAQGKVVMPGFVDPHTHAVWAGDRASEFEQRIAGATYLEIMQAGGGIMSTVRATRAASVDQLVEHTRPRLDRMLAHGTTTVEVKTGYGLQTDAELRCLDAIRQLDASHALDLIPTFLGAHAIPAEYRDREETYTDLIIKEMLPAARDHWRSNGATRSLYCDVFCEQGAFTLAQSRRILERGAELGFALKIHADEFEALGGTALAVELGAASADHLVVTPADEIAALGRSNTVAVSLPGTPFGLGHTHYTPAHAILEAGGVLALASDCNPGTTWCESMQMVIAIACRYLKLTPAQAIVATTMNAAHAIGLGDRVGTLQAGRQADVLILNVPDYRYIGYRYGVNLVETVIKRGRVVVDRSGEA